MVIGLLGFCLSGGLVFFFPDLSVITGIGIVWHSSDLHTSLRDKGLGFQGFPCGLPYCVTLDNQHTSPPRLT